MGTNDKKAKIYRQDILIQCLLVYYINEKEEKLIKPQYGMYRIHFLAFILAMNPAVFHFVQLHMRYVSLCLMI